MRAVAVPAPSPAKPGSSVLLVIEIRSAHLSGATGLELAAVAVDLNGKVRASDRYAATVTPIKADNTAHWLRVASRLDVPPGRYQLRIAARRTDGTAEGSVFMETEVPRFDSDVSLGRLAIGTPGARGVARAERISPSLPLTPIARRDVVPGMALHAALPLRLSTKHRGDEVEFAATLVSADGRSLELQRVRRPAREFTAAAGGTFEVEVPLSSLAPGEYRLRVDVSIGGSPTVGDEISFRLQPER